jgi:hypothetical protein
MVQMKNKLAKPFHFTRFGSTGFEFDPLATEVAILDKSGRPVWQGAKGEAPAPIRWMGINESGQTVETGDYICKIVYPNEKIAYLPFVFMRKP